MTNNKSRFPARSQAYALEPRVLFDGAGAVAAVEQLPASGEPVQHAPEAEQGAVPAAFAMPMLFGSAPEIESILRQTPSFDTTGAESVTFRVTFSEQVKGVTANSFVIAPGSLSGATIQLVTSVGSDGRQYDVVVGNLSGSGTLNIDLAANSGVKSQATDIALAATNPTDSSRDHSYSIDRVINAPSATAIDVGQVSQSTIITSANSEFTLSGRADAGDTVRIYLGSALVGSGVANPDGEWSVQVRPAAALADGSYNLVVRSNDAAGNTKAEAYVLQIDTGLPVPDPGASKVSDIIVTLQFNEPLKNSGVPALTDFSVNVDGSLVTPVHIAVSGNRVQLTLANPVQAGQVIKVSYGGNALRDAADGRVLHFSDLLISNDTKAGNQAPVIGGTAFAAGKNATWYSLGDPAVAVFGSRLANDTRTLLLTDADDTELEKAVASISGNFKSGDKLGVWDPLSQSLSVSGTLQSGIRYQFDAATGKLTFTGHATREQYETALQSVRFTASSDKDAKRTISLTVNDGQANSAVATRSIYVLGTAFSLDATTTSYLVGEISDFGGTGFDLVGVNLVMGTVDTVKLTDGSAYNDFTSSSVNALGFNPIDGHLYASLNADPRGVIRLDAETKTFVQISKYSDHTNAPTGTGAVNSADFDNKGVMWLYRDSKFYRLDLNPESATYGQWLKPISVSAYGGTDMSFSKDGRLFTADSGKLYEVTFAGLDGDSPTATSTQVTTTGVAIPTTSLYGFPMQYFDTNGYFYFTNGGTTIYRVNVSDSAAADYRKVTTINAGATLPTTGDAGRVVTINLDFGDSADSRYKTTLSNDGARHNLLGSEVWLGSRPDAETDAKSDSSTTPDSDEAVTEFPALRQGMSSYSVDVKVTNTGGEAATLIGWIDFNKDGKFSVNEAATITVPANTVNGTVRLTWTVPAGVTLTTGDTYVRLRIASEWNAATDVNGHDQRSYGPRMDGEVEDYKITIQAPDSIAPKITTVSVVDGNVGPRSTPVGKVEIVFSEPVVGVDISDFTLTRDGQTITLPANTPVSGSGTTWTIDLSAVTSPTGGYELSVPNGAGILDDAGNQLTDGGSISFEIDTTAPVIDLDTANDSSRDWRATSLAGAAVSLDNNNGPALVVEKDNGRSEITRIDITIYGIRDEGDERLIIGSAVFDASGGSGAQLGVNVDGVIVDISYSNGTFTIVRNGGGVLSQEQASTLIANLQYSNELGNAATNGERVFNITATDKAGVKSSPAVATVEVTGGSGSAGVQIPTVDSLYTANSTPTLTGQADVPPGQTLTVTVNGVDYSWQEGSAPGEPLQYDPDQHTWTLTIPDANALADGTYPVTATVTDGAENRTDITTNELVIDTLPPEPPTVVSQITSDLTPTITGSAEVRDGEYLEVTVNGVTYAEGDGNLLRVNNQWTLVIPQGDALTPNQTYNVTATTFDRAGNSRDDISSAELIIDTIAPTLDLNPADTKTLDDRVITYGSAVSLDVSTSPVGLAEDGGLLAHISITVDGLKDGSNEQLKLGSQTFSAAGASVASVQVAGVDFKISHSGSSFTITRTDAAPMSVEEAKSVIAALQYQNAAPSGTASSGERTFSFTVTDLAGLSSEAAVAHVVIPEPVTITSPVVNEASPYAVFTVTGTPGEVLTLALADGTGAKGAQGAGTDFGSKTSDPNLEYSLDNGETWIEYTGSSFTLTTGDGNLLVRTPIVSDADDEGSETFTLTVAAVGGSSATGTATINDDGSGNIFKSDGSQASLVPGAPDYVVPDDDRRVSVTSPQVNEASDHIVYTVSGTPGQSVDLALGSSGTATSGVDYTTGIQYSTDNGGSWITYSPDTPVVTPADGEILVRIELINDDLADNGETVILQVTPIGGHTSSGTATIRDDSTGDIFKDDGSEAPKYPADTGYVVPDDDRRVTVSSPDVNEASPHIVYTVSGTAGQSIELAVGATSTATVATDYQGTLQYSTDNGLNWNTYTTGTPVVTPAGGSVLVRLPLSNDSDLDGGETVVLEVTPVGGHTGSGTATIRDDSTGDIFKDDGSKASKDPADTGYVVPDDDRRVTVSSPDVNEASPHIVYTVSGTAGQAVQLAIAGGTATDGGVDYYGTLQYSTDNGSTWHDYSAAVVTPASGDFLVRVPLVNDSVADNGETVLLQATPVGGHSSTGTATILDEGSGDIFNPDGSLAPDTEGTPGYVQRDDDRRVTVTSPQVNESSPHVVYTVTGTPGQALEIEISGGTATEGSDYQPVVEYSIDDGQTWSIYEPGTSVVTPPSGEVLIRVPLINDALPDNNETLVVTVTPPGGYPAEGTATITDDGTGTVFGPDGKPRTDVVPGDDRPVTVSSPDVNEASDYIVYTVNGTPGQSVDLALGSSGTATSGVDYTTGIQYSTDNGGSWITYSPDTPVVTPADGEILVRIDLINDDLADNGETVILQVTPVGGHTSSGTATIRDDSTGDIFKDDGSEAPKDPADTGYVVPDDDRRVTVSSPEVNEASPHIVYTVSGTAGQAVQLAIAGGTATDGGVDYYGTLQYSTDNGSTWHDYSAAVVTPASGDFLVRVPLVNDSVADNGETVLLQATPVGGHSSTGTATILDEGSGDIFNPDGSLAPDTEGTPGYVQRDDDRRVTVTSPQVNESSPHVVYTVTGTPGQALEIEISGGTATEGSDYQPVVEYSIDDGQTWSIYEPGTSVVTPPSGEVLIRVPLINDALPDNNETLVVTVTPPGGYPAEGTATITDDGTGTVFGPDGKPRTDVVPGDDNNPSAGPVLSSESPDGRPITVDVVREASDPNGDPLRVTEINGQPVRPGQIIVIEQGTIRLDGEGRITFTPKPGTQESLTIQYTLSDPSGRSATGTWNITVQVAPVPQADDSSWGRPQGSFTYWSDASAAAFRPAQSLLLEDQARPLSVFFDGSVFDRVARLPIPLHPALFINNEVARTQAERERDDQRAQMSAYFNPAEQPRRFIATDPGFVPGQYVQGEVFNTQMLAKRLAEIAAGRFAPLVIEAGAEGVEQPDSDSDERGTQDASEQVGVSRNSGNATVGSAKSFTEQLRQGERRLPLAVR
ncbi:Ig-like domain-containing protein [Ectopseudomonas mendocina]|uniref:Ig-like domain-containing protein n=1 Tax=Ectopseudomonas mendocina TaxID=300 RepID=A0ABZ2RFH0_ECTME